MCPWVVESTLDEPRSGIDFGRQGDNIYPFVIAKAIWSDITIHRWPLFMKFYNPSCPCLSLKDKHAWHRAIPDKQEVGRYLNNADSLRCTKLQSDWLIWFVISRLVINSPVEIMKNRGSLLKWFKPFLPIKPILARWGDSRINPLLVHLISCLVSAIPRHSFSNPAAKRLSLVPRLRNMAGPTR